MKKLVSRLKDWKHWPFYIFYFPLFPTWFNYYIKSRSLWYFSASNPTIQFGGFEGETKTEIYKQLPASLLPATIYAHANEVFNNIQKKLSASGISFPFIVKPDAGMKGIMCRKIENITQLQSYHTAMPADYLIQEWVDMPEEISVFYIRMPWKNKGKITAIIQKQLAQVSGNGTSTLKQLIMSNAGLNDIKSTLLKTYKHQLNNVPKQGEKFILSHIANIPSGAVFTNITHLCNDKVLQFFDEISLATKFYYGRYDIKCDSVEDFLHLRRLCFIEFNGAGSVPNHVFTGVYTIHQAYAEIKKHWKDLYDISVYNHQQGLPYWSLIKGWKFMRSTKKHFDTLKKINRKLELP